MEFVEEGEPAGAAVATDTGSGVSSAADAAAASVAHSPMDVISGGGLVIPGATVIGE